MGTELHGYESCIEAFFGGRPYALVPIGGGVSYDIKVKACCDGAEYIIKVIEGNSGKADGNPKRLAWYEALRTIRDTDHRVLAPVWCGWTNGHVVTITEWVHGEQLNNLFDQCPGLMSQYGERVGKILYLLHHQNFVTQQISIMGVDVRAKTASAVSRLKGDIERYGIDFYGMENAIAYLDSHAGLVSADRAGIVHNDVRPENFIRRGGELFIYDFDSGDISDCFADFTYLTAISQERYRPFSCSVINSYFDGQVPAEFWDVNLYFSVMKLLDYAVYKYRRKGRRIVNQANAFMSMFADYKNPIPAWWRGEGPTNPL